MESEGARGTHRLESMEVRTSCDIRENSSESNQSSK